MSLKEHWNNRYSENEDSGLSWTELEPRISLEWIFEATTPDDVVVDVGAGRSKIIPALLEHGYKRPVHLELSEAAGRDMREQLGATRSEQVDWVCSDVCDWQPESQVSLWHDRAVFHFLTDEALRQRYIRNMEQALKADGTLIISSFHLDGPLKCSGLPVARYSSDTLLEELNRLGVDHWCLIDGLIHEHRTPGGNTQLFQYSRFKRC